jgi:hypothetical protein
MTRRATVEVFELASTLDTNGCVRVRVTLPLADYRQSLRLGSKPLEPHGQNFLSPLNTCGHSPDESMGLSFTIAAGPRQRSHSRVRVPWDSQPYFPFCLLLRLAGLRWKYSTPPPHGLTSPHSFGRTPNKFVRVRVTLQLAVYRQSVRLGTEPLETHSQYFFLN